MSDLNTLKQRTPGPAPDELDVLLRNFFQAEMPTPWPGMKAPVSRPAARPTSRRAPRSRLALAASVGFLMVGSWALSAHLPEYNAVGTEPVLKDIGGASRPNIKRNLGALDRNPLPANPGTPDR